MEAHVRLSTKCFYNRTVYDDVFFTPPYKCIAPLYENGEANIILLSSSAGLLKGDTIHMDFHFKEHSKVNIRSQSYEKIFDTQDGFVEKNITIQVDAHSCVRYIPHPTIPFKNSTYLCKTNITIAQSATFFYCDIFSSGRIFMGENFLMQKFHAHTQISIENTIVFADNTLINPTIWKYNSIGLWHDFTHNGLLYAYFPSQETEDAFITFVRQQASTLPTHFKTGVSKARQGVCIRVLGDNGDKIYYFFQKVTQFTSNNDVHLK